VKKKEVQRMNYVETYDTQIPVRDEDENRSQEASLPAGIEGNAVNVADSERVFSGLLGAALAVYSLTRTDAPTLAARLPLGVIGGLLLYRAFSGHCPMYAALRTGTGKHPDSPNAVIPHGQGIRIEKSVTIQRSARELYDFWRNFENLPHFMRHLEAVTIMDDKHSIWRAKPPLGQHVTWNAEIIADVPNERIAWRWVEPMDIPNAGTVRFTELPASRGTAVDVVLEYNPPGGILGAQIAKLLGEEPGDQVDDDLRQFKSLMEAGEIPTIIGQPQGVVGRTDSLP